VKGGDFSSLLQQGELSAKREICSFLSPLVQLSPIKNQDQYFLFRRALWIYLLKLQRNLKASGAMGTVRASPKRELWAEGKTMEPSPMA
jgi:hypothetical protein